MHSKTIKPLKQHFICGTLKFQGHLLYRKDIRSLFTNNFSTVFKETDSSDFPSTRPSKLHPKRLISQYVVTGQILYKINNAAPVVLRDRFNKRNVDHKPAANTTILEREVDAPELFLSGQPSPNTTRSSFSLQRFLIPWNKMFWSKINGQFFFSTYIGFGGYSTSNSCAPNAIVTASRGFSKVNHPERIQANSRSDRRVAR